MKIRKSSRNVFCKVNGHRLARTGIGWKCVGCGKRRYSRKLLLKALLPGLNALFNLEYAKYEQEHKALAEEASYERTN